MGTSFAGLMTAGATAGFITWFIAYPFDILKSVAQSTEKESKILEIVL